MLLLNQVEDLVNIGVGRRISSPSEQADSFSIVFQLSPISRARLHLKLSNHLLGQRIQRNGLKLLMPSIGDMMSPKSGKDEALKMVKDCVSSF
jgi:hypothetical protein